MSKENKKITIIPARRQFYNDDLLNGQKKRRVCAYARVSTNVEEQVSSFEAQLDYYKNYIAENENWAFCGLYSDEGISGTSTKKRDGFNKMLDDANIGKIDLIITKSLSRFARNTVDSLKTIRDLKSKGIEVYFEKENIWTFSQDGELLLTLMSSFAQEESRSISENIKWAKKRMMERGQYYVSYNNFLGYDKGENGLVINEEQAKVVRMIFDLFLDGYNSEQIKNELESKKILSPTGKSRWHNSTIINILKNEKYCGDALLQKTYVKDFMTHKTIKNKGEKTMYYIENCHKPIIDKNKFFLVQNELKKREGYNHSNKPFAKRIFCGDCGAECTRRGWKDRDGTYRIVYACKFKRKNKCFTHGMSEDEIIFKFVKAINYVIIHKEEILKNDKLKISKLQDNNELLLKKEKLIDDINKIALCDNVPNANEIINIKQAELSDIEHKINKEKIERLHIEEFIKELEKYKKIIKGFNLKLLNKMIDKMYIMKFDMTVRFMDGFELNV